MVTIDCRSQVQKEMVIKSGITILICFTTSSWRHTTVQSNILLVTYLLVDVYFVVAELAIWQTDSQGWICLHYFTCCNAERDNADKDFYPGQSYLKLDTKWTPSVLQSGMHTFKPPYMTPPPPPPPKKKKKKSGILTWVSPTPVGNLTR